MIGTALKNLATQYGMAINGDKAYGYLLGSFVTLSENLISRRLCIYVGSVYVQLPEGETLSPAAKCSALIADMVKQASGDANIFGLMHNRFMPSLVENHGGSVVALNFRRDEAGWNGMLRFIAEMMPRITPLTAPLQCSRCGGHTGSQGYPVQIAWDTVVPMHAACLAEYTKVFDAVHGGRNAWIRGLIGAILGAALGTVIWHLIGQTAAFAIITFILSELGYILLKGRKGLLQWGIVAACTVVLLLIGTGFGWMQSFHQQYANYGSVVQSMICESVYMKVAFRDLLASGQALRTVLLSIILPLLIHALFHIVDLIRIDRTDEQRPKAMPGQA